MNRPRSCTFLLLALLVVACSAGGRREAPSNSDNGDASTGAGGADFDGTASGGGNADCPDCEEQHTGVGTDSPFDPERQPSEGVVLDKDGALILNPSHADIPGVIWVANTSFGTVTKIDTTTYDILGRYAVGSVRPSLEYR